MSFLNQTVSLFATKPDRQIESIKVDVTLNESAADSLEITQHPVQQGAMTSDHAFKKPTTFSMQILQKYNYSVSLAETYQKFLDLQNKRVPFDVVTPKRIYKNMLLQTISQVTDNKTENCLSLSLGFQEVIIVRTSTTTVERSKQARPARTGKTQQAGRKSFLKVESEAVSQGISNLRGSS